MPPTWPSMRTRLCLRTLLILPRLLRMRRLMLRSCRAGGKLLLCGVFATAQRSGPLCFGAVTERLCSRTARFWRIRVSRSIVAESEQSGIGVLSWEVSAHSYAVFAFCLKLV
eukprot:15539_5